LLPPPSGHRSDHLAAAPQLDKERKRPSRPFKSHEACPRRHRGGQTPAGHSPSPTPVHSTKDDNGQRPGQAPLSRNPTIGTCLLFTMTKRTSKPRDHRSSRPQDRSF
jgi:hypothetical protein